MARYGSSGGSIFGFFLFLCEYLQDCQFYTYTVRFQSALPKYLLVLSSAFEVYLLCICHISTLSLPVVVALRGIACQLAVAPSSL